MGVKDTIGNVTSNVLNTVMGSGIFQPVLVQFGPKSANTMEDVDYNTDRIIEYMERACTGFPGRAWTLTPLERNKQNPNQLLSQHRIKVGCHQAYFYFIHVEKAAWLLPHQAAWEL